MRTISCYLAALIFTLSYASAQPPKMDTILYGAAYYQEYMPSDRLDQDIELMKRAGLSVVRLGESTWSSFEPQDGQFEFAWMDRILDKLHAANIKVILGTPTYSIPVWLYHKHPEILVTYLDGRKAQYGLRQNMDISHPVYRYYSERIIRKLISHYASNAAVIGYQIDNETSSYGTAGSSVQTNFVEYLKKKFGTVTELNRVWGLVYWGQLLGGWDEIPPRDGIINPGWKLEWERYQASLVTDFLAWQAKIVNEYKRPGQFITQDFSGGVHTNIDQWAIANSLDIVATNPYYPVQDELDGHPATLTDDVARSLKKSNFLVTETNAQTIGWDSKGQFPPYDGQLRLDVYNHIADGANMVEYWHWHSLHYGQETYWKGLLGHDLEPNRVFEEFSRTAHELQKIGPQLVNMKRRNDVAILFSRDSFHGIQFMPFSDTANYMTVLQQMHKALYDRNIGVDIVTPDSSFADYKVLFVPPLYVASDATLAKISQFVENGGHVVMSFKSGFTNEYDTVRAERAPGPLRKAAGFSYQEFSNLRQPLKLKGAEGTVSAWAEMILLDAAKPLAYYDHPFFSKYPAITRNQFGKGTLTYEGTLPSDDLQLWVVDGVLKLAGLSGPDQQLPPSIRAKHGMGNSGRMLRYYMNYSGRDQQFAYPHASGTDLLTGRAIAHDQSVTLSPWNLILVEEK